MAPDHARSRIGDGAARQHRRNWTLFEPYAFDGVPAGSMDADRWQTTIEYTAVTHGLSIVPGERFYRPELLTPALSPVAG